MSSWKRDAASGLIVLLPIIVTLYIVHWLYRLIAQVPLPGVETEAYQVMLTIVVFGMLVLSVGYMMRTAVGSLFEGAIDGMMNRVPGLRVIYNASKMAAETALSDTTDLQAPVKVEAWNGMRMTAFKTGKRTDDGKELLFLPTAPNITTGFVVEMDPADFEETDETVEDALTRVLSAGFGENSESGIPIDVQDERESGTGTESPPPQ
ncbi:DUF502 domain-containing protein [Halorussus salilacus]|uniref:DUF502 domain-containing protein n=1 Tax=Halorussus salilacus TaxID=2953750 RepID=UPI0020A055D6|nr:DUF502 domain-containing protein [Halorussus salilacus]USZ66889.1 DUF502 domain-containing protein [Halorussus salilacus]